MFYLGNGPEEYYGWNDIPETSNQNNLDNDFYDWYNEFEYGGYYGDEGWEGEE